MPFGPLLIENRDGQVPRSMALTAMHSKSSPMGNSKCFPGIRTKHPIHYQKHTDEHRKRHDCYEAPQKRCEDYGAA